MIGLSTRTAAVVIAVAMPPAISLAVEANLVPGSEKEGLTPNEIKSAWSVRHDGHSPAT